MKEILFRGKKIGGPWFFGNYTKENDDYIIIPKDITIPVPSNYSLDEAMENLRIYKFVNVDDFTVGQYTGMNDIHGNKIFEGDIVRSSFFVQGIVVYLEAVGAYIVSTEPPEIITTDENWNSDIDWIFICDCQDLEVVGNIVDGIFIHPKTNIEDISDLDSKGLNDILAEEDSNENNNN